jgi:hypothetical protein
MPRCSMWHPLCKRAFSMHLPRNRKDRAAVPMPLLRGRFFVRITSPIDTSQQVRTTTRVE